MRALFISCATLLVVSAGVAQSRAPGRDAIAELLTSPKSWKMYREHAGGEKPSDRAGVGRWEFVRRGSEVVGRTLSLAPGLNEEFEVVLRDDGFDYRRCCGYPPTYPMTSIDYHPEDKAYPFKRVNSPQKLWFSPE